MNQSAMTHVTHVDEEGKKQSMIKNQKVYHKLPQFLGKLTGFELPWRP